jgi:hypothetical protein
MINVLCVDPLCISNLYDSALGFGVGGLVGVNLMLHSRPSSADVMDVSLED